MPESRNWTAAYNTRAIDYTTFIWQCVVTYWPSGDVFYGEHALRDMALEAALEEMEQRYGNDDN